MPCAKMVRHIGGVVLFIMKRHRLLAFLRNARLFTVLAAARAEMFSRSSWKWSISSFARLWKNLPKGPASSFRYAPAGTLRQYERSATLTSARWTFFAGLSQAAGAKPHGLI